MGICPCSREKEAKLAHPTFSVQPTMRSDITDFESGELTQSGRKVEGTEKEGGVPWLMRPVDTYYEVGDNIWADESGELAQACYIGTQQSCTMRILSKRNHRKNIHNSSELLKHLSKLHHPSLLKTYEVFQDTQNLYIVSESFEGGTLGDYLFAHGPLSQVRAATVLHQVLSALGYCHQNGVAHLNLNLTTLVLKTAPTEDQICVKLMGLENFPFKKEGDVWDTNGFRSTTPCSPQKSDIWSCGILLYALLSGKLPFLPISKTRRRSSIPFPTPDWQGISREAMALLTAMLSPDGESRPTAQQCLSHPWVQKLAMVTTVTAKPVRTTLAKLRFLEAGSPIKDACLRYIINRMLDDSELAKYGEIFRALDRTGDGKISEESLLMSLRRIMPEEKARERVKEALAHADKNADHELDYSEFLMSSFPHRRLFSEATLKHVFHSLDREGNRRVSKKDLKYFYRTNSAPGAEDGWKDIEAACFGQGKLHVEYHEFEGLMLDAKILKKKTMTC